VSPTIAEIAAAAERAAARIAGLVRETPLELSRGFSHRAGANISLKLENLQHTGSFKLRGAMNRLLTSTVEERVNGCVTASSGNHGAAVAYATQKLETTGIIFVPEQTSPAKLELIRRYGGDVRLFGSDGLHAEQHARQFADQNGMYYISPYNDFEVIAGQGTCGIEIVSRLDDVDAAFIAVGGGGLVSGVGSVLKTRYPQMRIFGCQPEASAVMAKSVAAGRVLDLCSEPTLSDGTAGGVEADSITFGLTRKLVDEFILVSEAQIAAAMREYIDTERQLIEGAAGVAIAGLLAKREAVRGMNVAVVICGGNVNCETLRAVI